jgi:hypothetical protein
MSAEFHAVNVLRVGGADLKILCGQIELLMLRRLGEPGRVA